MENKGYQLMPFLGRGDFGFKGTDDLLTYVEFLNRHQYPSINTEVIKYAMVGSDEDKCICELTPGQKDLIKGIDFINNFPALFCLHVFDTLNLDEVVSDELEKLSPRFEGKDGRGPSYIAIKVYELNDKLVVVISDPYHIEYNVFFKHFDTLYKWITDNGEIYDNELKKVISLKEVNYNK